MRSTQVMASCPKKNFDCWTVSTTMPFEHGLWWDVISAEVLRQVSQLAYNAASMLQHRGSAAKKGN